jgi:hydroxyacylglutathione hydrolase
MMELIFEQVRVGGDRNFGYLLADRASGEGVLIDPSYTPEALVQRAVDQHITITHVINTHGHVDHVNGNVKAMELTGAPLAAHPSSAEKPTVLLDEGRPLAVGALRLSFLHTPGHCPDHIVIYESTHRLLLTGDLVFVGKVGGTKTDIDHRTEWDSLCRVLDQIPDEATLWPGHDYGVRPSSTVGLERVTNPFLLCADVEAFSQLKRDWPAYKKQMGLQ